MSKRFTATEKWQKQWYQDLSPRLKCLWQYICDNADAAGVWEPNFMLASFSIGENVEPRDMAAFGDRLAVMESGKVMVTTFIAFQYGGLSSKCPAHKPVWKMLKRHSLSDTLCHSLLRRLQDMEEEKEKDSKGSAEGNPALPAALDTPAFLEAWGRYVAYRVERKLSRLKPSSVTLRWAEMAAWGEVGAIASINQSIANGWQGLFEPTARGIAAGAKESLHSTTSRFGF